MSRTTSIAGVRPLGWLARVRAQCSRLAWACPAQLLARRSERGLTSILKVNLIRQDKSVKVRSPRGVGGVRPRYATQRAPPRTATLGHPLS
jgi:hypothetical protein